ncbi:MAG: sugar phosphate isomerase/epimerase family protein, partial [Terriglobales bacterium]
MPERRQSFQIGYQLLSWGRAYPRNWWAGVGACAAAGFAGVEGQATIAGVYAGREAVFADRMARLGTRLTALYSTTDFDRSAERAKNREKNRRAARFLRRMGARVLVAGGRDAAPGRAEDLAEIARQANALGREIWETDGIRFALHPHVGSRLADRAALDQVMDVTDPRHVFVCLDTAHLAAAGMDPADTLRTYAGRIAHVHCKDYVPEARDGLEIFAALGQGTLDWPGIVHALEAIGYDGWANVELDQTADPAAAARRNYGYLTETLRLKVAGPPRAAANRDTAVGCVAGARRRRAEGGQQPPVSSLAKSVRVPGGVSSRSRGRRPGEPRNSSEVSSESRRANRPGGR